MKIWPVEEITIEDYQEALYNDRIVTDEEKEQAFIDKIEELGFAGGIVVNRRTNTIISGAWRLKRLREKGIEKIYATVVDIDEPEERILNDLLNEHARDFDFSKKKAKLANIDVNSLKYLSASIRRIISPEVKKIQIPSSISNVLPHVKGRTLQERESPKGINESVKEAVLIHFTISPGERTYIDGIKEKHNIKTDYQIFMKGIKYLNGGGDDAVD